MATLKAEKREGKGKYAAFALRKAGRIPGVIYGKSMGKETELVSLSHKEALAFLKTGDRLVDLDVGGAPRKVVVKDVQHGLFDPEILHMDFRAVSENEEIEVTVDIVLAGEAPGAAAGGMLEQSIHAMPVRCLPKHIPHEITVDVSKLELDHVVYAEDLPKLEGVTYLFHGNPAVVACHLPRRAEEAEGGDGEAASAPEVIGEKEREAARAAKDKG